MSKGDLITKEDLIPLRPIPKEGIPPYEIDCLVGRRLRWEVKTDDIILWKDID